MALGTSTAHENGRSKRKAHPNMTPDGLYLRRRETQPTHSREIYAAILQRHEQANGC